MKTSLRQLLLAAFLASVVASSGPTAAIANEDFFPEQETEAITNARTPIMAGSLLPLSEGSNPVVEGQAPGLSRLVRTSPDVAKPGEYITFEWETAGGAPITEIQIHFVNDYNSRDLFFTIYPGREATFRVTPDQLSPGDHILTQVVVVGPDGTETIYSRTGSVSSTKPATLTPPPPLSNLSQLDFMVVYWTATAEPVVIEDRPGSAEDAFVIPSSPHLDYLFRKEGEPQEVVLAPGRYPRQGDDTHYFRAQAHSGYSPGGPRTAWDHRFSDAHPPYQVTPLPVTFVDFFDNGRGVYIIPTTPGVEYWVRDSVKTSGTHSAQGSVTVIAKPMTDYEITPGATATWTMTFTANELVPTPPTFLDMDGTAGDTYTIPATPNVEYLVNGSVRSAGTYPTTGTVTVTGLITVTARAKQGYSLAEGATASWQKTFSTKGAEYVPPARSPFTDVSTKQQFYKEMAWLSAQGISTGWDNGNGTRSYKPLTPINRDAMAAFLYRAAGSPAYAPPARSPFTDVSTKQQFYKEMAWLSAQGISTGWDNGNGTRSYKPLTPINRDAMAAFLYRAAGSPAYAPPARSPFTDVSTKQQFYKEMAWLSAQGISTGWDNGNGTRSYKPLSPINRDAMAAFLYRAERV